MPVRFYMDVNVTARVSEQLTLRGIDVLRADRDDSRTIDDLALLEYASSLDRVLVTFDIRFFVAACQWQAQGRPFAGLIFGHPNFLTIGQIVRELVLIGFCSEQEEWKNVACRLPL